VIGSNSCKLGPKMQKSFVSFAKSLVSILFVIAVWQFAHSVGLTNRNLFPASVKLFNDGVMMKDLKTSVLRAVVGFSVGASLGILAGILTARVALVRLAVYPSRLQSSGSASARSPSISSSPILFSSPSGWRPITGWNMCPRPISAPPAPLAHRGGVSFSRWSSLQPRRISSLA